MATRQISQKRKVLHRRWRVLRGAEREADPRARGGRLLPVRAPPYPRSNQSIGHFPEGGVEPYPERVNSRGLCAIARAESLRYKLLAGLAVRSL
ncbi:hypothetical protein ACP4OV_019080 [Aristida adscensionis]